MRIENAWRTIVAVGLLACVGCTEPEDEPTPGPSDMTSLPDSGHTDQDSNPADAGRDMSGEDGADSPDLAADMAPPRPAPGTPVQVDLEPWQGAADGASQGASVGMATEGDLLQGVVAHGKVGDYFLENEHGRYIIESDARAMSPCPFGGNVLDAAWRGPDGNLREDNLGEICLLINVSQTFVPQDYEVIQPGGEDQAAILAITGKLGQHDFLNFEAQVREYLPETIEVPIDLNAVYPATVTMYYILQPGAPNLQVIAALRNDGEEQLDMVTGHLIASGGVGSYFNPLGGRGGFGSKGLGADSLRGFDLPYMVFRGEESSYTYVPEVDESLTSTMPIGGVHLTEAGAVATLLRRASLSGTLLIRKQQVKSLPGALHLKPGEVGTVNHQLYVGDGDISTMLDRVYPTRGVETGAVEGIVRDREGAPLAGARVSAVNTSGEALNQAITDDAGAYRLVVPVGEYDMIARRPGQPSVEPVSVSVTADGSASADLELVPPGLIEITITTPDGNPTPGRVSVICDGDCPGAPTSQEEDVTTDALPGNFAAILPAGVDGKARGMLPAGDYRVVVSRGMEWSTWPTDLGEGGEAVTLVGGELTEIAAEIAHVVDSSGVVSGDFHIHSLASTDSAVGLTTRVLDFMTEGVDVMVSTDHDIITDFAPAIEALGAQGQITSVIGEEITTSDAGHINAFPLAYDATDRRRGALDWGNGEDIGLHLTDIFSWINDFPGEQVSQINHPTSTIGSLQVDTLRGTSFADPLVKRLPYSEPDPMTGDTHLWAENFTAMELMNGNNINRFFGIARWWMTMIGRGFSPTGTAVTDTHKLYSDLGGTPRSFVFIGQDHDTPATFDREAFAIAINEGRLIGSNGPFFTVTLENAAGATASPGDVLDATMDDTVTGTVHIELPEWMQADTVDLYTNRRDVITAPGQLVQEELTPDQRISFTLDANTDLVEVASGQHAHRKWTKDVTFEFDASEDAYLIVIVRGLNTGSLYPVVPARGTRPFAFANPVYIDADGGGWNTFPLADIAGAPGMSPMSYNTLDPFILPPHVQRGERAHHDHATRRTMTREELLMLIEEGRCDH